MAAILGITFPIYAAIAIGYAAVRFGLFRPGDMQVLGRFVLQLALPALLFRALASRDISEVLQPGYLLVFLMAGLAVVALAFAWFSLTATDRRRRAVAVLGSSCPNSGLIGYPMLLLVFPDIAGLVLGMNLLVETIVLIPLCLVLMDLAEDRAETSLLRILAGIAADLIRRPMIIGLLAGLAVSVIGFDMPAPVSRLFDMFATATSGLALMVIGGSLVGLPLAGNKAMAAQIAVAKLVMHPALAALAAAAVLATGMADLPPDLHRAAILSCAMPMLGIYAVLAQERGLGGAASIAMLAATTGAFFSLSLLLWWLV